MEVVVPNRVEAIAALRRVADLPGILRFVFTHKVDTPSARRCARPDGDGRQHMSGRGIVELMRGVQPQAIAMKLVDPVAGIGDEELPHRVAEFVIEVQRVAPLRLVAFAEIVRRELLHGMPARASGMRPDQ